MHDRINMLAVGLTFVTVVQKLQRYGAGMIPIADAIKGANAGHPATIHVNGWTYVVEYQGQTDTYSLRGYRGCGCHE